METGLDWKTGDQIAIAPTNYDYLASDYAIVSTYDATTGNLEVDRSLTYYHWGASTSTAATYSVDMRAEVVLLSRNIKIQGQDVEGWGGQILTSDFLEENGVWRNGITLMDNVEIYNCSQVDTQKAALRFDSSLSGYSKISNSAIHHGLGWGLMMTNAANVVLQNNVIFDFSTIGGNIMTSNNITIDGNLFFNFPIRSVTALD